MDKLKEKKIGIEIRLRALREEITGGKIKADDAKKKFDELRANLDQVNREIAQAAAPVERQVPAAGSTADMVKAMREKRAITLNGTGAINQIKELAKLLQQKTPVLEKVRMFYGPNASTNIPVLSPGLATPAKAAEGATNIAVDSTAAIGVKSLTPKAYVSILPVSLEALTLGIVDFESELNTIFSDTFSRTFHNQIVSGAGTGGDFQGLFTGIPSDNQMDCDKAGYPQIDDLVLLALTIRDYADDACIVLHPSIYAGILSDVTNQNLPYREEMIRGKTIEGVPLILTGSAPSAVTAGSIVAVAGRLSDYGFAVAGEISIDPIKKVGDTNTYFQASMFANGAKIIDKNFYGLTTIAAAA
jgi:HK97 family phage major capsid protein